MYGDWRAQVLRGDLHSGKTNLSDQADPVLGLEII